MDQIWNGQTKKMIYIHIDERKETKILRKISKDMIKIIKMIKVIFLVILKDFYFLDVDSPKDEIINYIFL